MDSTRIVGGASASPNEENIDRALRPTRISDYVGQKAVREQLDIFFCSALLGSARLRSRTSSPMKWAST